MRTAVLALWSALAVTPAAPAEPMFQGLGHFADGTYSAAHGVSPDGKVVLGIGKHSGSVYREAFRWTAADGIQGLGYISGPSTSENTAFAASADGSLIVGRDGGQGFTWTEVAGMAGLGYVGGWRPGAGSSALDVSADGSVIVGYSTSPSPLPVQAVRWRSDGLRSLGWLPGGGDHPDKGSKAMAVSADGRIIAGESYGDFYGKVAVRWVDEVIESLGDLSGGDYPWAQATAVSDDGSVVVGNGSRGDAYTCLEAFRWTPALGMQGLGTGGFSASYATDVSGDGTIVVGYGFRQYVGTAACLWDAAGQFRLLGNVLTQDYGLNLGGWWLDQALGISSDGRTIVGVGHNPLGQQEAWMAIIPEPGTLAILALGGLAILRRKRASDGEG